LYRYHHCDLNIFIIPQRNPVPTGSHFLPGFSHCSGWLHSLLPPCHHSSQLHNEIPYSTLLYPQVLQMMLEFKWTDSKCVPGTVLGAVNKKEFLL
jgi:hypothetical protein